VFRQIMLEVYRGKLAGPAPIFPAEMEQSIDAYLEGGSPKTREDPTTVAGGI
jgi:hypothetical protein